MALSINEIATQLAADLSLREARIREAGVQLARIEAEMTAAQDEVDAVKAQCHAACHAAKQERQASEAAALAVKQEVLQAKAALNALRDAHTKEQHDHRTALGELRAQYKAAGKVERDAIDRLVLTRNTIQQEIAGLVEKIKGLV